LFFFLPLFSVLFYNYCAFGSSVVTLPSAVACNFLEMPTVSLLHCEFVAVSEGAFRGRTPLELYNYSIGEFSKEEARTGPPTVFRVIVHSTGIR